MKTLTNELMKFIPYYGFYPGVFTTITAATIGFAIWDRRTMVRPFETKVKELDEKIEELKKEPLAKKLLDTLKEKAQTDKELEKILRSYHLL
ncbi:MAG: hypothetical protein KatS3mg028_0103 [Bacteroidia bacterium]|nr:MAG: hypothetical protein KatS3mg028_0103 [Bacteroidia bacterium]